MLGSSRRGESSTPEPPAGDSKMPVVASSARRLGMMRTWVVLLGVLASALAPRVQAATLTVSDVRQLQAAWLRITFGYDGGASIAVPAPSSPRPIVLPPPAPPAERSTSRLGLASRKDSTPLGRTSLAGLELSLNDRVTLLLSYERTAFAPLME